MNKKIVLVGIIIALLLVAGCSSIKAQKQNINFNVVWSEMYDDASSSSYSGGYRLLTKIDIPQDNRECYITRYIESVSMVCYNKT
jgi:hypothetical protein